MKSAYGFIETRGLTAAIEAADAMVKSAKVNIIKYQKIGSALVTVIIDGELAACQSAVAAGSAAAERTGELVSAHVIPHPFDDIRSIFGKDAKIVKPQRQQSAKATIKRSEINIQSDNRKKQVPKLKDESAVLLDWLASQKSGANLNQIAEYLGTDNAGARRSVKPLMDEGCIEKVHQKYFFLSKQKNK